ncbi:hypothetical protein CCE02nite_37410 [Cellulosimicrobium cellulans]|uniref:Uncharacterized protein n=1 Tax=Cellulosimicrobium cellulans TaxID=1710 RepID=A0A4Y4E2B9_CELCE|nr:hypothetical protein CCE02nite_37410 [Cellulosimicrobium cellulans]
MDLTGEDLEIDAVERSSPREDLDDALHLQERLGRVCGDHAVNLADLLTTVNHKIAVFCRCYNFVTSKSGHAVWGRGNAPTRRADRDSSGRWTRGTMAG